MAEANGKGERHETQKLYIEKAGKRSCGRTGRSVFLKVVCWAFVLQDCPLLEKDLHTEYLQKQTWSET